MVRCSLLARPRAPSTHTKSSGGGSRRRAHVTSALRASINKTTRKTSLQRRAVANSESEQAPSCTGRCKQIMRARSLPSSSSSLSHPCVFVCLCVCVRAYALTLPFAATAAAAPAAAAAAAAPIYNHINNIELSHHIRTYIYISIISASTQRRYIYVYISISLNHQKPHHT